MVQKEIYRMRRKRKGNSWHKYMSGNIGDRGFYIKNYGPFKTEEIAEFFNFIAFVNPRSLSAYDEAKSGIKYYEDHTGSIHPQKMLELNSSFCLWWSDIFGKPLSSTLLMKLAQEVGTKGYWGFIDWLEDGAR